jgi:hypothetical protein
LNKKFQTLYLPNQNIAIDESLTLWKGRLSFRQYLPLKASKFGIKTFELCESITGYLWCFLVYTGKNTVLESSLITPETPKTAAIVLKLLEPLLGHAHTLWIDKFYNSPELAQQLKIKFSTDCVGTLKLNRKNVPKEVKDKKLKKGEIIARHSGPVTVLKWCDKRSVTMVSTYHSADTQKVYKRGKETEKPLCVIDYNHNMGGVDLKDQLLHMYVVERKRMSKWYLKLFKRLLNSTVLNSIVVYRQVMGRNIEQLSYRIVSGRFVYKTCTCCGRIMYRGNTRLMTQYQGSLKDIFSGNWHPKLKNQIPRGCVYCVQSMEKRKLQCTAAKTVMWAFV